MLDRSPRRSVSNFRDRVGGGSVNIVVSGSMIDTTDKCEKCGGQMVVILASNPARSECKTCGHHVDFLWDPALPDDCYKQLDSTLTIDHFQSVDERNRVAIELRALLGISPKEAMRLVRALPINIDWPFERGMWRLIDLSARLVGAGVSCTITHRERR